MISLTQMTGFLTKQRKNKAFKIQYFFVDSYGTLYYLSNLAQLNYYIKNSNNEQEIIQKLESSNVVQQMSIQNCRISGIKTQQAYENIPFYHKQHFEIQLSKKKKKNEDSVIKTFQIYATIEDDIEILQDVIKQGSQKQRPIIQQKQESDADKKDAYLEKIIQLFQKYQGVDICINETEFEKCKIQYSGETQNGKPEGQGKLFYIQEGIQFQGNFKNGKKNGAGIIFNADLDTIECEFEDDILTGI